MDQGAGALAKFQGLAFLQELGHKGDGSAKRCEIVCAAEMKGGEGRGKSAAGAVAVCCVDARMLHGLDGQWTADKKIGHAGAIFMNMPPRDNDIPQAGKTLEEPVYGLKHFIPVVTSCAGQGLKFMEIGGQNRGAADDTKQRVQVVLFIKSMTVGGLENRIIDDFTGKNAQKILNDGGNFIISHHADFDVADRHVVQNKLHLFAKKIWINWEAGFNTQGVLGGEGGDCRAAINSQGGEGLEIRLDSGSTGGVGAGYGQNHPQLFFVGVDFIRGG